MLSTLFAVTEIGVKLSYYGAYWTYNGIHYLVYGPRKDPILLELERLRADNNVVAGALSHPDLIFYQELKDSGEIDSNKYYLIKDREIVARTGSKKDILGQLAELANEDMTFLLIQPHCSPTFL